ncbi:SpoIIE family protein phosphatase [Fimbriiglobus ruber]|uniref:ATP-binding SpoIIE family protein phosphatase n=1 Tax=Fimbriiglobus ruber TaxID=1908690 RepID=UPI003B845F37
MVVDDPSRVGEARRVAVAIAASVAMSDVDQGRVALIATEAATNLIKHAGGGEIVVRSVPTELGGGVELLALDRGPGIVDVGKSLRDGFSTTGTAGNGLGAIRRLSDEFDMTSTSNIGTAILARVRDKQTAGSHQKRYWRSGAVCLPVAGEVVCGDAWVVMTSAEQTSILVADGLGHGLAAATASGEAVRVFRGMAHAPLERILRDLHSALRPTRGAAVAVTTVDHSTRTLQYAGIGNIAGVIAGPDKRQGLVSLNGTLGHELRKIQVFEYQWPPEAVLVLHSDGLATQWDLHRYPGLSSRHPGLIAGVLYRDFRRGRDDVTVLAIRDRDEGPS